MKNATMVTAESITMCHPYTAVTEASTLGFDVGVFPLALQTTLGNGRPFMYVREVIEGQRYEQQFGVMVLVVLND